MANSVEAAARDGEAARQAELAWARDNPAGKASSSLKDNLTLWNFDVGSADAKPEHLDALAAFVARLPGALSPQRCSSAFEVVGFASATGGVSENLALAEQRARTIAGYLQAAGFLRVAPRAGGIAGRVERGKPGASYARDRMVELWVDTPDLPERPRAPRPPPPGGAQPAAPEDDGAGAQLGFVVQGKWALGPIPIHPYLLVDLEFEGEIGIQCGSRDARNKVQVAFASDASGTSRLTGEFKRAFADGITGFLKVGPGMQTGGAVAPLGLQGGLQLDELALQPKVGLQATAKPIFLKLHVFAYTMPPFAWNGIPVTATFKGAFIFNAGPSPVLLARLGPLASAAETLGPLVAAAVVIPLTVHGVIAAQAEGERRARLWAARDAVAARAAYETCGNELDRRTLIDLMAQWRSLGSGLVAEAANGAYVATDRSLVRLKGNDAKAYDALLARWKTDYAAGDGSLEFGAVRERMFQKLGGLDAGGDEAPSLDQL